MNSEDIGNRLRHYRLEAGYKNIKEFCKIANIPYTTYRPIETGERQPRQETLIAICEALNIPMKTILSDGPKPQIEQDIETVKYDLMSAKYKVSELPDSSIEIEQFGVWSDYGGTKKVYMSSDEWTDFCSNYMETRRQMQTTLIRYALSQIATTKHAMQVETK